jgi:hypothetical protein
MSAASKNGTFPDKWGPPQGSPHSVTRELWVRSKVEQYATRSGASALRLLERRQYLDGYRRVAGDAVPVSPAEALRWLQQQRRADGGSAA